MENRKKKYIIYVDHGLFKVEGIVKEATGYFLKIVNEEDVIVFIATTSYTIVEE